MLDGPLREALAVIEPYRDYPRFGSAWDAVARTYVREGAEAARKRAEEIADAYLDVKALRELSRP